MAQSDAQTRGLLKLLVLGGGLVFWWYCATFSVLGVIFGLVLALLIRLALRPQPKVRSIISLIFFIFGVFLAAFSPELGISEAATLHQQYFGLEIQFSLQKILANLQRVFTNFQMVFKGWPFGIKNLLFPIVFYAVWTVACGVAVKFLFRLLRTETAEQRLLREAAERRRHHARRADFSQMQKAGFSGPDVPLGIDLWERSGKSPIYLPAEMLNKHVCLVGTTGSGKTVTLYNFVNSALANNKAVVFIDGKGDPGNIGKFEETCRRYGKRPEIITLDGRRGYNPFSSGTPTELTDKLISMFDWSEEHYRLGATRFVQLLVKYMQLENIPVTLANIVKYCDIKFLLNYHLSAKGAGEAAGADQAQGGSDQAGTEGPNFDMPSFDSLPATPKAKPDLAKRDIKRQNEQDEIIEKLKSVDKNSVSGVRDRIATLAEGDMGDMFSDPEAVNLSDLIESGGCILFSVDSLRYPQQAKALGRLVTNDLKNSVSIHARNGSRPVGLFLDEFNVFASHEVVDVINKSRSAGYEALLAFQSLSDIDKLDSGEALRRQIIQNCNTLIVHRQNDSKDAEELSGLFGTFEKTETTYQQERDGEAGAGSVRMVHEYRVHPDEIKDLPVGQAFVKVAAVGQTKVQIMPN